MKLDQNPEEIHWGSHAKPWGEPRAEGDAPAPVFTSLACTNLPHHSLHKSLMGGKTWGTSRAQRTFCRLAAPHAPPHNTLGYLVSNKLNIFKFSNKFYWVLHYLALMLRKLCVLPTFSWLLSQGISQGERQFCFCSKSTKHAAVPRKRSVVPVLIHSKE